MIDRLADLIAKLEAAPNGSDKLDREIAMVCDIKWSPEEDGNFGGYDLLPRRCYFTSSLDAALTLVPEGLHEEIKRAKHRKGWRVNLWNDHGLGQSADAPTAPLAICIAALRARHP